MSVGLIRRYGSPARNTKGRLREEGTGVVSKRVTKSTTVPSDEARDSIFGYEVGGEMAAA